MITAHPTSLNLNIQGCCEYTKNENIKYNKTKQKMHRSPGQGGKMYHIYKWEKNKKDATPSQVHLLY